MREWKALRDAAREKEKAGRKKPFYCGGGGGPLGSATSTTLASKVTNKTSSKLRIYMIPIY